jgi:peptidyl-prolyl cis-trans isomerase SurA
MSDRTKKDGAIDDALLLDEKIDKLKSDSKSQLDYLIREKLVESEVKKLNLTLSEDRVDSEMTTLAKRNQMSKTDLEAYIKKQGYSLAEYRKSFESTSRKTIFL